MTLAVSQQLLIRASWGLKFRVAIGAAISLFDAVSDLLVIQYFISNNQIGFATANIAMLSMTLLLSFLISLIQTHATKNPLRNLAFETIFTITFLKPALDAYRISSGQEQKEGQKIPPLSELMYGKCIEMVAEAIPSACVQTFALLVNKEKPFIMMLSVFLSASTIGYSTSLISYDKDIEPGGRRTQPWIYGYIDVSPLKRALAFVSMTSVSALQVFMKAIMIGLLGVAGKDLLFIYLGIEISIYLVWKVIRGDFRYFIPLENEGVSLLLSLLVRVVELIIFDFSAMVHLRHPYQLGGTAWCFFLIWSQLSVYVAVPIYNMRLDEVEYDPDAEGIEGRVSSSTLYMFLGTINALWLFSAGIFFLVIKPSFIKTFYSTMTAPQNCRKMFDDGADPEKMNILTDHHKFRASFEDEFKEYIRESWPRWIEENPEWFNPQRLISEMPQHYVTELNLGTESDWSSGGGPSTPLSGDSLSDTFGVQRKRSESLTKIRPRPSSYSLRRPQKFGLADDQNRTLRLEEAKSRE
ncbi:hypothetical protein TrVE_jg6277 [Triparma verrucosa]|uniref:Uncharacterized protein n=1 Tax=Triparma verrucosa TaxID=1606542 RepID=A0A9W7BG47_9STRA|nr:hypothetical protein TrVE_jg6277 [Triparma verrucosa]